MAVRFAVSLLVLALASQACSKGSSVDETPAPESGPSDPASSGSGADAAGGAGAGGGAAGGAMSVDPAAVEQGDRIFHGRMANGSCYACHGSKGKGSGVAPRLDDSEWLNGDGSLESIATIVREGVPTPKKSSSPMPPMGGAKLTDEQVNAVAAYVFSLSNK